MSAKIYQTGSEGSPLTGFLSDNGVAPDAQAGDGVYTAALSGLAPGNYLAEVTLQSGSDRLSAGADFQVVADSVHFSGDKSDAGVDTNSDGLFDIVRLSFGVVVDTAGTYDTFAELRTAAGAVVRGGGRSLKRPNG